MIEYPAAALVIHFKIGLLLHIFGFPGGVPGNKYRNAKYAGKYQPGKGIGKRIIFTRELHNDARDGNRKKPPELRADHAHAGKAATLFIAVCHFRCQRFPRDQHHRRQQFNREIGAQVVPVAHVRQPQQGIQKHER